MQRTIVITSINRKTGAVSKFEQLEGWSLLVIGDRKSQPFECGYGTRFLSVDDQLKLDFRYAHTAPFNHYARKNIGYLLAMSEGSEVIYDTDDDNWPKANWSMPLSACSLMVGQPGGQYANIYSYFSEKPIWPRGFPLDELSEGGQLTTRASEPAPIGIWQGLADGDPDVDAIYRLLNTDETLFKSKPPVFLDKNIYCPLNSQNTFWNPALFPLLYLPAHVSFRFTDILRGYVAQFLAWHHGYHVGFTEATVFQERNEHDLMKDFEDEIECYTQVKKVVEALNEGEYGGSVLENLLVAYEHLIRAGIAQKSELNLLNDWASDINQMSGKGGDS